MVDPAGHACVIETVVAIRRGCVQHVDTHDHADRCDGAREHFCHPGTRSNDDDIGFQRLAVQHGALIGIGLDAAAFDNTTQFLKSLHCGQDGTMRHNHARFRFVERIGDFRRPELRKVVLDIIARKARIGYSDLVEGRGRCVFPVAMAFGRQDQRAVLVVQLLTCFGFQFHPARAGIPDPACIELVRAGNCTENTVIVGR